MRDTFTGLNITLCFPVPEFMVAVGFLLLLVMEQLILALRDERERGQKEGREEKEALLLHSPTVRTHPDPVLSTVYSSVLLLSLCLSFFLQGLSVDTVQLRPDVLLRSSLLTCSLVVLLFQSHVRRSAVSVCLVLLSLASPLGLVLRHTHQSVPLARCTLEGLSAGNVAYIVFMDIIPRVTSANQQRIAKVTLIVTGFSVFTAALLLKI
ncbi:Zinc transporter ZIP1 [Bagarius yarrelli]|uniref:Zinc transporter ZIP1 n=1 Tax=Bagarius yarrelli TaxID=175774 RepID=A0A556TUT1_BAGYA|nr:Zinc transporter ZIP1 [Bagarius yarrelli]